MRLGLGPVFAYEWLAISRRWQIYAGRALFVATLLGAMTVGWAAHVASKPYLTIHEQAAVGQVYFNALVGTELWFVLLVAPAAAAGALGTGSARPTLAQMLATDLSAAEIVLGKLAARLVPVVAIIACVAPVLALGSLLGGIDLEAMAGACLITLAVGVLGCTLAAVLSVWGTGTHEILLSVYAAWALWLLPSPTWQLLGWYWGIGPQPTWFEKAHPMRLAFAPYTQPGTVDLRDDLAFFGIVMVVSLILTTIAIARLRAVATRQADGPSRPTSANHHRARGGRGSRGPTLDDNPLRWRERRVGQLSRWGRTLAMAYAGVGGAYAVLAIIDGVTGWGTTRDWLPACVNAYLLAIGAPIPGVIAAIALAHDRAAGSVDVLLTTPLSTRSIVWAKWRNAVRSIPLIVLLPSLVGASLALQGGSWLVVALMVALAAAQAAALTSLGLALATWERRLGRALAFFVGLAFLLTASWPDVVCSLFEYDTARLLAMISPFQGAWQLTLAIRDPDAIAALQTMSWGAFWLLVALAATVALLLASLASFNRCLGRIPERSRRHQQLSSD
jgi:ABC-type Na+ efflux pump permease subunit